MTKSKSEVKNEKQQNLFCLFLLFSSFFSLFSTFSSSSFLWRVGGGVRGGAGGGEWRDGGGMRGGWGGGEWEGGGGIIITSGRSRLNVIMISFLAAKYPGHSSVPM